jgi:hypothetical protein
MAGPGLPIDTGAATRLAVVTVVSLSFKPGTSYDKIA